MIKSICVFCGASNAVDDVYFDAANDLGGLIAKNKLKLVFGAGSKGLMGAVAKSAKSNGADVYGVIPDFLVKLEGLDHSNGEMVVVKDMHERKGKMYGASDAFIILPGGIGTLDELFETFTWRQIDVHNKPIVIINTNNYWDFFKDILNAVVGHKFAKESVAEMVKIVDSPAEAIEYLKSFNIK